MSEEEEMFVNFVWSNDVNKQLNGEVLKELEDEPNRVTLTEIGSLVIRDAVKADEGDYVCQARNMVGTRSSRSGTLHVNVFMRHFALLVKPIFIQRPEDVTTTSGSKIELTCLVAGDPEPNLIWKRENDLPLPEGSQVVKGILEIAKATPQDEGMYTCEATNPVGKVSQSVVLTVHAHPNFLVKPKDQRVGMNGIAKFECVVDGNPPPSIFWTKEGSQELMFSGTTHGQMHVTTDGTLMIQAERYLGQRSFEGLFLFSSGSKGISNLKLDATESDYPLLGTRKDSHQMTFPVRIRPSISTAKTISLLLGQLFCSSQGTIEQRTFYFT
eukprot:TCALIF_12225-PA protein Name:"Similar to sax-3 Protein sax-3 (Caenorhabditis elegans)" AED:0.39 eAED:0.39 QI:0/0.33/0.14/0.85/0.66/0.85/7/2139/326